MNENYQYSNSSATGYSDNVVSKALAGSFGWMFIGLIVSAIAAISVLFSESLITFIYLTPFGFYTLVGVELVLVIVLSANIKRLPVAVAGLMFLVYSVINGLTLSSVLLAYQIQVVYAAFFGAAVMFGVMAVYGVVTKSDLTSAGSILIMGLVGMIVATLINLFLRSDVLDTMLCYLGIAIFAGLTAYDAQKIKRLALESSDSAGLQKVMIMGALTLYLDFINIFLKLLRLLNKKK